MSQQHIDPPNASMRQNMKHCVLAFENPAHMAFFFFKDEHQSICDNFQAFLNKNYLEEGVKPADRLGIETQGYCVAQLNLDDCEEEKAAAFRKHVAVMQKGGFLNWDEKHYTPMEMLEELLKRSGLQL